MTVDFEKARDFVYGNGTLFERALFAYLFENDNPDRLETVILCYKNRDNGFGHGFEHDLKTPDSNPLALEYLLGVMKHARVPRGRILDGTADWVESCMDADGNLRNPESTRRYPLAPWWQEAGGQTMPDSIVGNLIHFGAATPSLIEKTRRWAIARYSLDSVRANEWLFMAYHAVDYFFAIDDFPRLEDFRRATVENVIACAEKAPESQYDSLFAFAPEPDSAIAKALPTGLISRFLDHLESAQNEDGSWVDQHNLPQWYSITTINVLLALRRYGRWQHRRGAVA